jgi:hypothetical protein
VQAHDATAVSICKKPDCPNEAPSRGRYAGYCDEHRDLKPKTNSSVGQGVRQFGPKPPVKQPFAQKVAELAALAKKVDKAKAIATVATQKALIAKGEADELEKQLRSALEAV